MPVLLKKRLLVSRVENPLASTLVLIFSYSPNPAQYKQMHATLHFVCVAFIVFHFVQGASRNLSSN